ncbi:MAG: hypothetical protein ACR2NZ_01440 [Rubripirellula sp.]
MPLDSIVTEILQLSERRASTPVLVTPAYLSFRGDFFLELVTAVGRQSSRRVRLDWYRGMPGPMTILADRVASRRVNRINRQLSAQSADPAESAYMQITAAIGRPGGSKRDLVIGLADARLELPGWTTPIRLGATPGELVALQSSSKLTA